MVKGAERILVLACCGLLTHAGLAQSILQRPVRVDAAHVRLSEALALIAREGDFKLSYNAAAVNGDSVVSVAVNGTVKNALVSVVGPRFELKETGNHIILLGQSGVRKRFSIAGAVFDAVTKGPVVMATVHEVDGKNAASTDALGTFTLDLSGERERTAILVMRKEYHDTIVYVGRDGNFGRLALRKRSVVTPMEPICLHDRCGVEDLGVARLLVSDQRMELAENLDFEERSMWQLSLIPNVSTNGDIAGAVVNNFSFNLLAGYSRGLEGFELGGIANIESHNVEGLQVAGFTNLVGRNTSGVQIAGAINHTMGTLEGLQLAGLGNTVWDTLSGVQIAGGANVVKGGLRGTQIAGACNVATQNVDGIQIAGGVNVTPKQVRKAQIAGGANYARSVSGAQIAAGVNVARDSVGGGQVGFGANYARVVGGGQVSFGANVALLEVSGGQVGFGLNYAGASTGGQFSFGANIVPGSVEGGQVGFGLNYAGSITGGQFTFGLNAVSGTAKGGQVGVVNFARRCEGGQFGILNISDTIIGNAVGLLTLSLKGYHRFDLSTNDAMPLSVQFRTGTRGFHNILGYSPSVAPDQRWGFLYGFGTQPRIGKVGFLNIDLTGEQIVEQREWIDAVNILGRFSVSYGIRLTDALVISAGPLFNLLASDWRDPDTGAYLSELPPSAPVMRSMSGTTQLSAWFGWKASLGLQF